jgi:ankyrin repeat protein
LITIVDEDDSQVVQFSHFSVKEFLTSSRLASSSADVSRFHVLLESAHTVLAKACLGVLLRLDENADWYYVKKSFPLARYAAEHWVSHAQFESVSSHIGDGMGSLFDPDEPYFATWLRVHDIDTYPSSESAFWYLSNKGPNMATPLYYAAFCGFYDLAEHLIVKHPRQVNANGGHYVSPLGAALGRGYLDVAELLYRHGADVDVRGYEMSTPLISAPIGREPGKIVMWLLSHGADLTLRKSDFRTALHLAAFNGQVEVTRILLEHKADQNAPDREGRTPLHLASLNGHIDVVRLLVEDGVDMGAQDNNCSTALHLASREGHVDVGRFLLEHGIDVNARNNDRSTALHLASGEGRINVVRLLVEHGVDVNAQDNSRSTALHLASWNSDLKIVRLLLDHGADVEAEDNRGKTPLQVVSDYQRDEITKLLLEHRAVDEV